MTEHLHSNSAAVPLPVQAAEEAQLALQPLETRRQQVLDALGKVDVGDDEDARRALDKIALAKALREESDKLLEPIGGPYRDANHAVRNRSQIFADPLKAAEGKVQRAIDAFRTRQREAAAAAANAQAERERQLRIEAGLESGAEPAPTVKASDVKLGPLRSDYRGHAFDRKVVKVTIVDARLLPDTVLQAPGVVAALEAAVRRLAGLTKDIPGATVEDGQATSVKVG